MEHEVIRDIIAILTRPHEVIRGIIAMHVISTHTKSKRIPTPANIPQGSLHGANIVLYMYYNADLLDILQHQGLNLSFIDDIVYGIQRQIDKKTYANSKPN